MSAVHDKEKGASEADVSVVGLGAYATSDLEIDPAEDRRVRWKIDRTILVVFSLIYMFQYLDKIALSCTSLTSGSKCDPAGRGSLRGGV